MTSMYYDCSVTLKYCDERYYFEENVVNSDDVVTFYFGFIIEVCFFLLRIR